MNDKQGYNVTAVYDSWPAWKKEVTLTKYSSGDIGNKTNAGPKSKNNKPTNTQKSNE